MKQVDYDVVVCGAGVAGVAAAVAAARRGARTVLIEKQCLIGGLATSGLVYIFLPLCDGRGRQVTFGLAEEMLKRSVEYGPFDVPERWGGPKGGDPGVGGERYQCAFSPAGMVLALDRMLEEAGVELCLDTVITGAVKREKRLTAMEVFDLSGGRRIGGKCFVDATGSAAAVGLAGGAVLSETNYVTPWFLEMTPEPEHYRFTGPLHVRTLGENTPEYEVPPGYDGRETTGFVRRTWRMMREYYDKFDREGRRASYPVQLSAMAQFRKLGRIDGRYNMSGADEGKHFDRAVGAAGNWFRPGPAWEVPYEALLPKDVEGVLAAGRCIGAGGEAWEVLRVIPAAVMTGEASGVAAALCAERGILPGELPFEDLRRELAAFAPSRS